MKIFDYVTGKDIALLEKRIADLQQQVNDLKERTTFPAFYAPELYINHAVQAIADHLNIRVVPEPSSYTPPTARVIATAINVPERKKK